MKIAVTYEDGQVFQHFGHTENMKIYDVQDGKILDSQVVSTQGTGHGALAGFLRDQGVQALICGGIGFGARQALGEAGITLYAGVSGYADAAVEALLANNLQYSQDATCDHHEGEGHHCHGDGHGHEHHCHGHGDGHGHEHHCHGGNQGDQGGCH